MSENSLSPLSSAPDSKMVDATPKNEVTYRGITIEGLDFLESRSLARREEIFAILDQLPERYADLTQLGKIVFDSRKHFTVMRNGKTAMVDETGILPTDQVLRRARGSTGLNHDEEGYPTDGKQIITIFSTEGWEGEDPSEVTKYALTHELGHTTWNAIDPDKAPRVWQDLQAIGRMPQFPIYDYTPLVEAWRSLEESRLPRFISYKNDIIRERTREQKGREYTEEELLQIEDFAVTHEYYLYWKSLVNMDSNRSQLLDLIYEVLDPTANK